jgi:hypothetical protein
LRHASAAAFSRPSEAETLTMLTAGSTPRNHVLRLIARSVAVGEARAGTGRSAQAVTAVRVRISAVLLAIS